MDLIANVLRHARTDGEHVTSVPGMALLRADGPTIMQRGILRPMFCVVLQGDKVAQAGDTVFRYGAGSFLCSSIDMPIVGQILEATRTKPFVAVRFDLTPHDVLSVIDEARIHVEEGASTATFVGPADARMLDAVARCVRALDDDRDAKFLGPMLKRELVYRLVTGPSAHAMQQSALLARSDDGVGRAVTWIKDHFKEAVTIAQLAKLSHMSTSSLQHKFKATVLMGPLQYQKRLRLEEARRLLFGGHADATSAALDVGYASASQFTREYRRQFGLPPRRDIQRMRRDRARTPRDPASLAAP